MKKIKKIVISLLLFSFAFILVHDYVVSNNHVETAYTQVQEISVNTDAEMFSDLHESIHSLIAYNMNVIPFIAMESVYQKELETKDFFVSQIIPVLQRPPLI